jgi:hypothetical protein
MTRAFDDQFEGIEKIEGIIDAAPARSISSVRLRRNATTKSSCNVSWPRKARSIAAGALRSMASSGLKPGSSSGDWKPK